MEEMFNFDDGLFEEDDKKITKDQPFEALIKDSGWFLKESHEPWPDNERVSIVKHQADYSYLKGDFDEACRQYETMLALLPSSNVVTRRECYENLARCCCKADRHCDALQFSSLLHQTSRNVEQLTVSLSCQVDVNLLCGQYRQAALYCMQLITIHKLNSHIWLRLTYSLASIFEVDVPSIAALQKMTGNLKSNSCSCSRETCTVRNTPGGDGQEKNKSDTLVLFCAMMSKYILQSVQGTAIGFSVDSISEQIAKINSDIKPLLEAASEYEVKLDHIVTKLVFGYSKDSTNAESSKSDAYIDRGSSLFKSDAIEVSFSNVLDVTWDSFFEKWFGEVLRLLGGV